VSASRLRKPVWMSRLVYHAPRPLPPTLPSVRAITQRLLAFAYQN